MNIGLKTEHVDKTFVYENGVCLDGEQKLTVSMMAIWMEKQVDTLNPKEPFVVTIGSMIYPMTKDENSTKLVMSLVHAFIASNTKYIQIHERVSGLADPEKKGFERVWTNRSEYLTSGDSKLTPQAFVERLEAIMVNCLETLRSVESSLPVYTISRPDINMEVNFTTSTFHNGELLQSKIKSIASMIQ